MTNVTCSWAPATAPALQWECEGSRFGVSVTPKHTHSELLCASFQHSNPSALQLSVFRCSFSSSPLTFFMPWTNPQLSVIQVLAPQLECDKKGGGGEKCSLTIPNPECQHHPSSTWAHTQLEQGLISKFIPSSHVHKHLSSWERQRPWARAAFDRRPRLLIHSSTSLNFSGGKQGCFA